MNTRKSKTIAGKSTAPPRTGLSDSWRLCWSYCCSSWSGPRGVTTEHSDSRVWLSSSKGRKEGLHQGVRGKQTLWGRRQPCTLQSRSPARRLGPQSRISSLMRGLNPLSGMLTFSSIPPLMTGSGSGPACKTNKQKNNRRAGGQKTRLPGWDTSRPAPPGSGELLLCEIKSLPAAHLSFHRHLLCYIAEARAPSYFIHTWFICFGDGAPLGSLPRPLPLC